MNHRNLPRATLLAALLFLTQPFTQTGSAADAGAPRQYAPSREINLLHLALDVKPDFRKRSVEGQAILRFKPIALPLRELRLDAVDLTVTNLTSTARVQGWQVTRDKIIITFESEIPAGREESVTISYRAQPTDGLFFRTPEEGYPATDEHLWTQGEAIAARHWYPGLDSPNSKFTSEITCRVPEGMVVLSNGRKMSEEKSGGLVAVRWLQDKPHANYLLALVAGHLQKLEDHHRDVPLGFWTVPSDAPQAATTFAGTRDMMAFFEQETGVPYPWARYDQVCVADFTAGGMENTTLTVLNTYTLFRPETENLRTSQGLIAHELSHQWFGDLVTCKDWGQLWLNEGFATYYEELYDEHKNGRDEFLYRMWEGAKSITGQLNDPRPIVSRDFKNPDEMFDWRSYGKGGWVLHMLRHQLGPDLYRRCIKTYLERHAYGSVTTEDLNNVIEELSGRSFDQFFDQWVYHAGTPRLEADYSWDEVSKQARLTLRQTQAVTDKVLLFQLPLTVRFQCGGSTVDRQILVKEKSEDFHFQLSQAPETVRLDPDVTVLAQITFRPSGPMLEAQLKNELDVVGRLLAIEQLQSRKDPETVARLQRVLNGDHFRGVRIEAANALGAIHTGEARAALLASMKQTDAQVRQAVVAAVGRFYEEDTLAAVLRVTDEEKNPDIKAGAIQALGAWARPETRQVILKNLQSTSYQERLADAAIRAMRRQLDAQYFEPLLETLRRHDQDWPRHTFAAGLDAVAVLARGQSNATVALEFVSRHTADRRQPVRLAAITALGTIEDPRALPVLETFTAAAADSPEHKAAEKAIEAIRAARKPVVELGDLRREVGELQKQNRDLKRDLEILQKRLDTVEAAKPKAPLRPAGRLH